MPRYHFNIIDGVSTLDREGSEISNFRQARIEAIRLAGHVLLDHSEQVDRFDDWRLEVTDDTGLILLRLDLLLIETAATMVLTRGAKQLAQA